MGKLANFAVFGSDPRGLTPAELRALEVEETWVEGSVVYQRAQRDRAD